MLSRVSIVTSIAALAGGAFFSVRRWERDDSFVLLRRAREPAPAGAPASLLVPAPDDAGAARVRHLMSDRLAGELLRTLAMTRRLVVATAPERSVSRARAEAPTYLALGASDRLDGWPHPDREIGTGWWRQRLPDDLPIVWIDDADPARAEIGRALAAAGEVPVGERLRDAVALQQIVSGLGGAILSLVAPPEARPAGDQGTRDALANGYLRFLDVVNAEWRSAQDDAALAEARALLRRADWFADVRGNRGMIPFTVRGTRCGLGWNDVNVDVDVDPAARDLVRDPTVIATVLYRIAASPAGRRLATDETYRDLVVDRPPAGVSPGRLLGAFRNFQGKLLTAWNRAVRGGDAPRDLVDLIELYAAAYPEERADVTRIFLVTTYGRTAQPGGIDPDLSPERLASRLAELTADVLFGRRDLRGGLPRPL